MTEELRDRLMEAQREKGFSVEGFSRRDFGIMLVICNEVLSDSELLEQVNPLNKFEGLELELETLGNKISNFLDGE